MISERGRRNPHDPPHHGIGSPARGAPRARGHGAEGGVAGGVGVVVVQLARLAGARVIGTGSSSSADFLRELGAEPVAYGEGWRTGSAP